MQGAKATANNNAEAAGHDKSKGDRYKDKKLKEAKGYKSKIKRHRDAVLSIYSVDGPNGDMLISGSADHSVRSKLINSITLIL